MIMGHVGRANVNTNYIIFIEGVIGNSDVLIGCTRHPNGVITIVSACSVFRVKNILINSNSIGIGVKKNKFCRRPSIEVIEP